MKKQSENPTPDDATWFDHQQLIFWLKACLIDATVFLKSSFNTREAFDKMYSGGVETMREYKDEYQFLYEKETLDAYHFIVVTGNLLRVFERAQYLFPEIQPPYKKAEHLRTEAKHLRNMIEHAHGHNGYLIGKGNHPKEFVRDGAPIPGVSADALSTIINEQGHWLGGRLCVERILFEVSDILEIAQQIPAPIQQVE
jgi:hypothetical protein